LGLVSSKEAPPGENQRLDPLDKSDIADDQTLRPAGLPLELVRGDHFFKDSRQVLPGRLQVVGPQTPILPFQVQQTIALALAHDLVISDCVRWNTPPCRLKRLPRGMRPENRGSSYRYSSKTATKSTRKRKPSKTGGDSSHLVPDQKLISATRDSTRRRAFVFMIIGAGMGHFLTVL